MNSDKTWTEYQDRLNATGLTCLKAKIDDHQWGTVTLPNGFRVIVKAGINSHNEVMLQPEQIVAYILCQTLKRKEAAPMIDKEGDKLDRGFKDGQYWPFVENNKLYAEQWSSVPNKRDLGRRIVEGTVTHHTLDEYGNKKVIPLNRVELDIQPILDFINEDPVNNLIYN